MTVRYSARIARWIGEREGRAADGADGSITVEHPIADPDWAVRHVLQYGPDAEVLAPAAMRARVAARLRGIGHEGDADA
jgi:predicted DNA-binding transcriptional regulator YafY